MNSEVDRQANKVSALVSPEVLPKLSEERSRTHKHKHEHARTHIGKAVVAAAAKRFAVYTVKKLFS